MQKTHEYVKRFHFVKVDRIICKRYGMSNIAPRMDIFVKMSNPHDLWANVYEQVYEQCFGSFYGELTKELLRVINEMPNTRSIVDFGAGTGRLSIPLAQHGFDVNAVEISRGMCDELLHKAGRENVVLKVHHKCIADYQNTASDLAISIFTVLSYITTEAEMKKSIENIGKRVVSGGHFLFDLPSQLLFQGSQFESPTLSRKIEISPLNLPDTYHYQEECRGVFEGREFDYKDDFKIRYWKPEVIDSMLREAGFIDTGVTLPQFQGTYSTYKLYRKI